MHASFYRRPLFLLLVFYALCLALFLKPPAAEEGDFIAAPPNAAIELSPLTYPEVKKDRTSFIARVNKIDGAAYNFKTYVYCLNCGEVLKGRDYLLHGSIEPVESADNLGSFSWQKYLARKRVFSRLNAVQGGARAAAVNSRFWVAMSKTRAHILKTFEDNFDAALLPILGGVTIGEKGDIDRRLYTAFQDSGAMHLLVASGANVGFVTLIVYFLCALLGAGRKTSAAFALILALFYTLIAGADAPLLRAYIMTLCATLGFLLGRKSGILQGFIMAALFILLVNPQSIFDAGFQMSFLATLAIILLACNFKLSHKMPRLPRVIIELFLVSLAAQLALLPVFTNVFYKVSLTAPFSNIALVPLSGVILGGGFFVWLLSFLHVDFLFNGAVFILARLLFAFKWLVEAFASLQISNLTASAWKATSVLAYYCAFFAFLNRPIARRKILYTLFWCFVICGILFVGLFTGRRGEYALQGRFNKSLIVKQRGQIKVIGAGVEPEVLSNAVLALGGKKIDCLFLNALNKSAVYGLRGLKDIKIKNIYFPYSDIPAETQAVILETGAKAAFLWPGEEACGVKAQSGKFMYELGPWRAGANLKEIERI
ncbi:MAG: ComEC family competence protein [Elusimicrobiota bacterium]|jgi:competence protein ComEC|nr:ComEC family competence protein [Elusimicrobiota bacterium]